MTHDPLCPGCVAADGLCDSNCASCLCELIAKVREAAFRSGYEAAMEDGWGEPGHIRAALDAAVQRVEALRYAPQEMYEVADMYHAAIAAIKGQP